VQEKNFSIPLIEFIEKTIKLKPFFHAPKESNYFVYSWEINEETPSEPS
jgi:hypothetical protein